VTYRCIWISCCLGE